MLGGGVHPVCSVPMLGARAWPQAASLGHHLWGIRKKDLERVDCGELANSLLLKLTFPRLERKPPMASGVVVTIAKMEEDRGSPVHSCLVLLPHSEVLCVRAAVQGARKRGRQDHLRGAG